MSTTGAPQQQPDSRTVRDIVDDSPELVTDAWCRKVVAQLLRSIETQQAMQAPHRIIIPDTVVVHEDGEAELLASPNPHSEYRPPIETDLKALATVIHFAITAEMPPRAPLAGRSLPGYSAALVDTVDRCIRGDRTQRPHSVGDMRGMLAAEAARPQAALLVADPVPEPAAPQPQPVLHAEPLVQPAPVLQPEPIPQPEPQAVLHAQDEPVPQAQPEAAPPASPPAPPRTARRLLLSVLAIGVLGAAGYGLYELGRQAGADEQRALALAAAPPPVVQAAAEPAPAETPAPPDGLVMAQEPQTDAGVAAPDVTPGTQATPADTTADANAADAGQAAASDSAVLSTSYKLVIKPWGKVFVDGVERGVSPPIKYLKLSGGARTVRIENPGYPSREFTVDAGKNRWGRIAHDFRKTN